MKLDGSDPPSETVASAETSTTDSNKSTPAAVKKVCFPALPANFYYPYDAQPTEKRPEVRLLDFCDVPGMTFGPEYSFAQKVAFSKRPKTDHPSSSSGKSLFLFYDSSLIILRIATVDQTVKKNCSDAALDKGRFLSLGPVLVPSQNTMRAHLAELEADLVNVDFRLEYFFQQHNHLANAVQEAKLAIQHGHK
jgi:hypothetical protein